MREITLSSRGAKKLIKAANSKAKMRINNVQYRLIISKLMTFLFLRRSLERFAEESKTNCYHRIKRRKKQEIEERQVQTEHSAINVKYPLWNIPWHLPPRTGIRPVFTEVSSLPLGPPHWSLSCFPNSTSAAYGFLLHVLDVYGAFKRPQHNSHNQDKDSDKESLRG